MLCSFLSAGKRLRHGTAVSCGGIFFLSFIRGPSVECPSAFRRRRFWYLVKPAEFTPCNLCILWGIAEIFGFYGWLSGRKTDGLLPKPVIYKGTVGRAGVSPDAEHSRLLRFYKAYKPPIGRRTPGDGLMRRQDERRAAA